MTLFRRRSETTAPVQPVSQRAVPSSGLLAAVRASLLPSEIVPRMAEFGLRGCRGENQLFAPGPYQFELHRLAPVARQRWLAALTEDVVAESGWAICGAQTVVMEALGHPVELTEYRKLLDASLAFQRAEGLWESQLNGKEIRYWRERHGDEPWQQPREQPARGEAAITPLGLGEERRLWRMFRLPDSSELYVKHDAPNSYVSLGEYTDLDTGRRARLEQRRFGSLYDLYCDIGMLARVPCPWVDPELEPFFAVPTPRAVTAAGEPSVVEKPADFRQAAVDAVNLASELNDRGDVDGAARELLRAADLGDSMAAYNLAALLNRQKGDLDGAERMYRQADEAEVQPAACNLGTVLEVRGDLDGAEAAYRRAGDRGDSLGAYYLGLLLLEKRRDQDGAATAFRHATKLGSAEAAQSLATLLHRCGDLAGAAAARRWAEELGAQ